MKPKMTLQLDDRRLTIIHSAGMAGLAMTLVYLGLADKSQNPDTEGDKSYEKLLKFNQIG